MHASPCVCMYDLGAHAWGLCSAWVLALMRACACACACACVCVCMHRLAHTRASHRKIRRKIRRAMGWPHAGHQRPRPLQRWPRLHGSVLLRLRDRRLAVDSSHGRSLHAWLCRPNAGAASLKRVQANLTCACKMGSHMYVCRHAGSCACVGTHAHRTTKHARATFTPGSLSPLARVMHGCWRAHTCCEVKPVQANQACAGCRHPCVSIWSTHGAVKKKGASM
jgi:hypothetical protein